MSGAVTIVGGETLHAGLAELQPLAETIFGGRGRRSGWFARKLAREGVEAQLCAVARAGSEALGYALLGRLASRPGLARGAGVGVLPGARGRGIGRALVDFACERAASSGCPETEFLVEPARLSWYEAAGFARVRSEQCLAAPGLAAGPRLARLRSPARPMSPAPAWSWAPEIWSFTPASQRLFVACPGAQLWLTRESPNWLVMRAESETDQALLAALDSLRRHLPSSTSLLLYPIEAESPLSAQLLQAGFTTIQSSFIVRRRT